MLGGGAYVAHRLRTLTQRHRCLRASQILAVGPVSLLLALRLVRISRMSTMSTRSATSPRSSASCGSRLSLWCSRSEQNADMCRHVQTCGDTCRHVQTAESESSPFGLLGWGVCCAKSVSFIGELDGVREQARRAHILCWDVSAHPIHLSVKFCFEKACRESTLWLGRFSSGASQEKQCGGQFHCKGQQH